jgi:hypothetical protein
MTNLISPHEQSFHTLAKPNEETANVVLSDNACFVLEAGSA